MIDWPKPKWRPPLRTVGLPPRKTPSPKLRRPVEPKPPSLTVVPTVSASERKDPRCEPAPREYFCRQCDRRVSGNAPPAGWINIQRYILCGSIGGQQGGRPKGKAFQRATMRLGLFCSWDCLSEAMRRLGELNQTLNDRGIGLRSLAPGEAAPVLPRAVERGGPE
jgi:hypothetical protein